MLDQQNKPEYFECSDRSDYFFEHTDNEDFVDFLIQALQELTTHSDLADKLGYRDTKYTTADRSLACDMARIIEAILTLNYAVKESFQRMPYEKFFTDEYFKHRESLNDRREGGK